MSDFYAIAVLLALGIATTCAVYFIDQVMWKRRNAVLTGVVEGVPVSAPHRRIEFYGAWLLPACGLCGYQLGVVIAWAVLAQTIVAAGAVYQVRVFAYLCLFVGVIGFLYVVYQAAFGYMQLRSVLRQAEAD